MNIKLKWVAALVGLLVLGGSIGRAIVARKAQQTALAQSTASVKADAVVLQAQDLFTVQSTALQRSVAVSGSLVAQRSAIVKAKVAGELLKLSVREGDAVRQDQVIGMIDMQDADTRLQQAKQQAAASKAQSHIAEQTLDNNRALVQQGFISRTALDTSTLNAQAARATYEAALSAVQLARKQVADTHVRAPLSGQVSQRLAQVGERVNVDARLLEIVDLRSLELQAPLSPTDVTQVRVGTPALLRVDGIDAPIEARIVRINPSASSDTRAVTVYLALKPHPALRQGLFAQGQLLLDQRQTLAVPAAAISRDTGTDQVLALRGDKVVRVAVTLGTRGSPPGADKALVEVLGGLQAGDRILPDAASTVREGATVRMAPAR